MSICELIISIIFSAVKFCLTLFWNPTELSTIGFIIAFIVFSQGSSDFWWLLPWVIVYFLFESLLLAFVGALLHLSYSENR